MKNIKSIILVNFITMIRVIGTFILPFICTKFNAKELVIYIILLLLTDSIDGILARRLNVSCIFGALLDALADKLLGIGTLCVLVQYYPIILLPIIGETLITLINTCGASYGSRLESTMLGKSKTWIMGISIVIGFLTIYSNEFMLLLNETTKEGIKILEIFSYMQNHNNVIMYSLAFITFGCDLMVAFDYFTRAKTDAQNVKESGIDAKKYHLKKGRDLSYALFNHDYYIKTKNIPIIERLGVVKDERKD